MIDTGSDCEGAAIHDMRAAFSDGVEPVSSYGASSGCVRLLLRKGTYEAIVRLLGWSINGVGVELCSGEEGGSELPYLLLCQVVTTTSDRGG